MTADAPIVLRLAEIRRAFDETFAAPAVIDGVERQSLLVIRAGGGRFAARIEELAGVEACRKIVRLPGGAEGLLGIAGIRGRLLAVYDLGALLGRPAEPRGAPGSRWLLVCNGDLGIGLLIEEIEALVRVAEPDILPAAKEAAGEHVRAVLRRGDTALGVIDVASIAAAVARRASGAVRERR